MRIYSILSLLIVFSFTVRSQKYEKRGDLYLKVSNYGRAIKDYNKELKKQPNRKELHEKLAICYLRSNVNKAAALTHTSFIIKSDSSTQSVINQAKALFYNHEFKNAMDDFEWVKKHEKEGSDFYEEAHKYQQWVMNAQAYVKNPVDVSFINLGASINTRQSELNPFVTDDESFLLFSSDKRYHSYAGVNYYNVCYSTRGGDKWNKGKTIGSSVNSEYEEIVAGFIPDGSKLFVFHNKKGHETIGVSKYRGKGRFDTLEDFGHPINKRKGRYGVWLTQSKDTLLFSGETERGDTDIFYAIKLPNGKYGQPRPLSININTNKDENFPVLTDGGKRLYFSSDGAHSMGGADLFYSDYNSTTKTWSKPVNLGYPINDMYDNFSISWVKDKRYAYVSAVKPEGEGQRDIYKVVFNQKEVKPIIIKAQVLQEGDGGNVLLGKNVSVEVNDSVSGKLVAKYRCTGDSANFVMVLKPGNYKLCIKVDGEYMYEESASIPEMYYSAIPEKKLFVLPRDEDEIKASR